LAGKLKLRGEESYFMYPATTEEKSRGWRKKTVTESGEKAKERRKCL
jgi:hypothetical protein